MSPIMGDQIPTRRTFAAGAGAKPAKGAAKSPSMSGKGSAKIASTKAAPVVQTQEEVVKVVKEKTPEQLLEIQKRDEARAEARDLSVKLKDITNPLSRYLRVLYLTSNKKKFPSSLLLRRYLALCDSNLDLEYVIKTLNSFTQKKMPITTKDMSILTDMCIRVDSPQVAVQIIEHFKSRLPPLSKGSWADLMFSISNKKDSEMMFRSLRVALASLGDVSPTIIRRYFFYFCRTEDFAQAVKAAEHCKKRNVKVPISVMKSMYYHCKKVNAAEAMMYFAAELTQSGVELESITESSEGVQSVHEEDEAGDKITDAAVDGDKKTTEELDIPGILENMKEDLKME